MVPLPDDKNDAKDGLNPLLRMPCAPGAPGAQGAQASLASPVLDLSNHAPGSYYTQKQRQHFVEAYLLGKFSVREFCRQHRISLATFSSWLRRYEEGGPSALADRPRGPQRPLDSSSTATKKARHKTPSALPLYSPLQKRAIVESYLASPLAPAKVAESFGITTTTLLRWARIYRTEGADGLSRKKRGPKPGTDVTPPKGVIKSTTAQAIVETKRRFPDFGLRKIRDFLLRFRGVRVSANGVGAVLDRAGIEREVPKRKLRRKPDQIRRFERALPMDLWQTDITSFYLGKESRRVYLTVFIDDRSRYVVSFGLMHQQRAELVIEAFKDGVSRFGKPKEVLTDQGRQYYAWRGKSEFQTLLHREGIQHVVARAHHPETVGKCERLWATIQREFWSKILPENIDDARRRLALYLIHYNHFRPHQGIDGLVPADRFFKAEDLARQTIEKAADQNALSSALEKKPLKPVFLFGQIGDRQVSLHGEHGKLVIQTEDGREETIEVREREAISDHAETANCDPPFSMVKPAQEEEKSEEVDHDQGN